MMLKNVELDHVFVFTSPQAPFVSQIQQAGFLEGSQARHLGQGTANRRFFYHNAYLEFIWVTDEVEVKSPLIARTNLWERSNWKILKRNPFGIGLRSSGKLDGQTPFQSWPYNPPYLPSQHPIQIASNDGYMDEPLIFIYQPAMRPDSQHANFCEPLYHPNGAKEITSVRVTLPQMRNISEAVKKLLELGIVNFIEGPDYFMEVTFDYGHQGKSIDLRPHSPIALRW